MSSTTRSKKKQSSSLIPSLPEDIVLDILARVRRCYYPKLSLVSKHFRSLVASHELYARRSSLGCTEHCLHVVLRKGETNKHKLYTLRRDANGKHHLVPSLLNMPPDGIFVAVGSRMYVFGRLNPYYIDCRSQKGHRLPCMNATMSVLADMWPGGGCVVMAGKIYTRNACVIDDILYYYESYYDVLRAYNPKENSWVRVNGLKEFLAEKKYSHWLYTGSNDGKLVFIEVKLDLGHVIELIIY